MISLYSEQTEYKLDVSSYLKGINLVMRCTVSYNVIHFHGSPSGYSEHITTYRQRFSASGASIVAIDNKIEQAMDLVKSHLMYAVREEVEVLKEQIKELYERNSVLERENAVLKSLANNEQLSQLSTQSTSNCSSGPKLLPQPGFTQTQPPQQQPPPKLDVTQTMNHPPPQQQPNVTSA